MMYVSGLTHYYITALNWQGRGLIRDILAADLHVVGKIYCAFMRSIGQLFYMAADLPLPKRVFAHGWWTNEGQKISKSLGNTIDPLKMVNEFGCDQTRYFLYEKCLSGVMATSFAVHLFNV